ncbi:leucine--tRNA ligase [Candidatus Woesearchaeota archaeon]|nr:leucine--tRNA ligase [Candidatus Woesearchaeota archaeon]
MADFNKIANKWQKRWEENTIFRVKEDPKKKKYYVLEMYPYPSGSGLHMGHARNYCIGDAFARYKRMNGFNVLYPMGYDSLGLPAENAAVKAKSHPRIFTDNAIATFIKQQKSLGLSYDWDRMVQTHKPDYYRWDQWIFLKMLEKGIAYKRKAFANWCPKCKTVLANEQVHNGRCWRHQDTEVELKELNQWFFRITDYAEELLEDIEKLEWSEDVKTMQRNWIGKSRGTLIDFKIEGSDKNLTVFTTRPDTLFGITYLVYAPEHPDVAELVKGTPYEKPVAEFARKVALEDRFKRTAEDKEKEGMFIGRYAVHPATKEKIPIYCANFVLYEYGTGAIIAVPAHDQRDFEFARKYDIPIRVVISPPDFDLDPQKMSRAFIGDGDIVNSGKFDGMNNRDAIEDITRYLEKIGKGRSTVQYKLRDWLVSRQRFWGTPIPIIYCERCGTVPVPEKDLPVKLPDDINFTSAKNPLVDYSPFVDVKCPKCGGPGKRETDTMDTFVNSSWYFLRYCDPHNEKQIFDSRKADYWMPVDVYIGGKEHACMHLIYFRFYQKFLSDLGLVKAREPCKRLFNQGMVHKDGVVMSKSKGNVVLPEEVSEKYGIDTGRLFLLFVAGPDKDMEWSDQAVEGSYRFLKKLFSLVEKEIVDAEDRKQESKLNKTIVEVDSYMEDFRFNMAIISLMDLANYLYTKEKINSSVLERLVKLMSPFTPHICEEMWEKLGNNPFVSLAAWPKADKKKIDLAVDAQEDLVSNTVADIARIKDLVDIKNPEKITLIVAPEWKYSLFRDVKKELETSHDPGKIMKAVMVPEHGKEISRLVPSLVKDPGKLPGHVLDQGTEIEALKDASDMLGKEFKTDVAVIRAEDSDDKKAASALPGKPAILVA